MTKKVNIYPSTPITNVQPIIRSTIKNATKDTETIRKCIISRAKVEEILATGEIVKLDLSNYDKDNTLSKGKEVVNNKSVVKEEPISDKTPTENVGDDKAEETKVIEDAITTDEVVNEDKTEDVAVEVEDKENESEEETDAVVEEAINEDEDTAEEVEDKTDKDSIDKINDELDSINTSDVNDEDDGVDNDEPGL